MLRDNALPRLAQQASMAVDSAKAWGDIQEHDNIQIQ